MTHHHNKAIRRVDYEDLRSFGPRLEDLGYAEACAITRRPSTSQRRPARSSAGAQSWMLSFPDLSAARLRGWIVGRLSMFKRRTSGLA